MSKKVKNDNGLYFVGENANDVTGSAILCKFNNKQILMECGLYQSNDFLESYKINSKKFKFNPSEINYVFVNHVHIDHIGNIPRLVKEGFRGKIITSHATAMLMKPLLINCAFILDSEARIISNRYKRNYSPIYSEEDVYKTFDLIEEYDELDVVKVLDEVVSFQWMSNSHCLGARQLRLILTDNNGVKRSVLYTSDLGALNNNNHYVDNTEIPKMFNQVTIMESTYGEPGRQNKKTREFDLEHLRVAINTVTERGGTVVMPCFSFSRTQEILTNLYEIYHKDPTFIYDIVVDSMLSCEISKLYNNILEDENLELWEKVCNWDNVKFITEKDESIACVKAHIPKVVLSSSGFCTNGRILSYLHEYLSDEKSMVIFSGYAGADNSYLSYRIKNYKENKKITISGDPVKNNADCISLNTFSSHANRKDLLEYGSSINTEKLVLVHGSIVAKNSLKDDLEKEISKKDKCFKVVASSKDMFLKL